MPKHMIVLSNSEPSKCLDLNVKVLKIVGLWPSREENEGWITTFGYYFPRITVLSATVMIISKCIDTIFIDSSLNQITEHLFMSLMALMAILKNSSLIYRGPELEQLIKKIENVNKSELKADRKQLAIHNQHQRYVQILTKIYLTVVSLIASTVIVAPLTKKEDERKMPHRMYYPYNHTITPYYELTYAWISITAISDGLFIGICDSLFLSLLISVIGHYKVLQYKMANMREYAVQKVMAKNENILVMDVHYETAARNNLRGNYVRNMANKHRVLQITTTATNDNSQIFKSRLQHYRKDVKTYSIRNQNAKEIAVREEMENYISNVVEHHKEIMSMVDGIETVFGIVLLYQFVPSLFFLCNVAFKVAGASQIDGKFVLLMQLLLASITQLFLYCWYSTSLTDESTKLNEALYHCNWLKSSLKFKKSVQLILLRANKPVHLNAAGFVHVSLELFRNVLKTSYSFYTLLNQFGSPTNNN